MHLYMQPFMRARACVRVCVGMGAVKDLVRLSACVAASNRWRVIDLQYVQNILRAGTFLQSSHDNNEMLYL